MANEPNEQARLARFVADIRRLNASERAGLRACVQADGTTTLNAALDQADPTVRDSLRAQVAIIGIPGRYCVAPWVTLGHRSVAGTDPDLLGPARAPGAPIRTR